MIVGRLVGKIDARLLMTFGFSLLAFACWQFGGLNLDIAIRNVTWPNVISGFAMGFVFVPVTTACMANLPNEQMGNATGIFNLMRNIGGSFGISLATTLVARGTQAHQALMVGHLSPYDPHFQQYLRTLTGALAHYGNPAIAAQRAHEAVGGVLLRNATLWAYVDTFRVLALLCLLCVPLVWMFRKARPHAGPVGVH
jgi:DHA2 family multidrug resistance protein